MKRLDDKIWKAKLNRTKIKLKNRNKISVQMSQARVVFILRCIRRKMTS